ncbi:unnamed protein product, partial [Brachionus calyciflorus]
MVSSVYARLRQICSLSLDKKNLTLGGHGRIVEIDESMYAKVKHWKGKDLDRERVWVFGLVDRKQPNDEVDNSKCYMEIVEYREAKTLVSIVYEKVKSGTIIYSDCWASYNKLSKFKDYQHKTVNHSLNFIDPETGCCTNRIESLWNSCKQKFKEMKGCKRVYIQSYINEYLWQFMNKLTNDRVLCYNSILKEIGLFYKPGTNSIDFDSLIGEKLPEFDANNPEVLNDISVNPGLLSFDKDSNSDCGSVLGSIQGDFGSEISEEDYQNLEVEEEIDDQQESESFSTLTESSTRQNTTKIQNEHDNTDV